MRGRGVGAGHWALAVLLGCVVLLAGSSTALAAAGSAKITGKVTQFSSPATGIEGVAVRVYTEGGEVAGFTHTLASGEYAVEGLAPGLYTVEFNPAGLNYVRQYYKESSLLSGATPVVLAAEGETKTGIDAKLVEGGQITGTVVEFTEGKAVVPLESVEVRAYEATGSEPLVGFATTGVAGTYDIAGLATGSYKVMFAPAFGSALNFVTQYYEDAASSATATPVSVTQGTTTTAVGAEMRVGGIIEGTVTDAATHQPVANVVVSASSPGHPEVTGGLAETNGNGEYAIRGLQSGSYDLEFEYFPEGAGAPEYITQTQLGVGVAQGSTTSPVDAALLPRPPVSNELFTPKSPLPAIIRAGPPSTSAATVPVIRLSSTKIGVAGGAASVPLACAKAACKGTITLTGQVVVKHRKGKRTISKTTTVVLGRGSYSLAAGTSSTVALRLTSKGKIMLAKGRGHSSSAKASVTVTGGRTVSGSVQLHETAHRGRKSKHK